jgi:flagellar biosynthesis/type III secretory pathway M-ring protein FliF/YscJ
MEGLAMDAIKQQLLRIQQQLAGLTASQKMLTASLVVIMIMTMFYWSRYAGTAEMAPLLDQQLSADEIAQMKTALAAKGVTYTVEGDKIMVPSDKKFELIADLGYAQLLPNNIKSGFEDVILKNDNPFNGQKKSDALWNHAKEVNLSQIIGRWPGVKSATVMIDGTNKPSPSLSRAVQPTAAVAIWTKNSDVATRKLVDASADLIVGAQAGLPRGNVKVTINGQSYKTRDADNNNAFDGDNPFLEAKSKYEQYYSDKILSQLTYIAGAHATVSVDLQTKTMQIQNKTVDPKNKVELMKKQTTSSEENATSTPSGEPGAPPNTGLSIADGSNGGNAGQNSNIEKNEIEMTGDWGYTHTNTMAPAGDAMPVAAAVRAPVSYFAGVWKQEHPDKTVPPTSAEIEDIVTRETPHIRDAVRAATGIKDQDAISVAKYIDITQPITGSEATASTLASLPTGFGFGAKEIAIGALAIISLFMVSMMVRKSVPQPVLAAIEATPADAALASPPSAVDMTTEVGEGGIMMTGHELTDDAIEAKQVIEQVGTMVKENPDVAANLVKRWLNRE